MNSEDKILDLFDDYFKSASKEEIENDVAYINGIGTNGVTLEQYLTILNSATSYNLSDNGICDDIAFADLFNNTIKKVQMGNDEDIRIGEKPILINCDSGNLGFTTYALAA